MQIWKEKVGDAILAMQANTKIMNFIREQYMTLGQDKYSVFHGSAYDIQQFFGNVQAIIANTSLQIPRAQLLLDTIMDHRELVSDTPGVLFFFFVLFAFETSDS